MHRLGTYCKSDWTAIGKSIGNILNIYCKNYCKAVGQAIGKLVQSYYKQVLEIYWGINLTIV